MPSYTALVLTAFAALMAVPSSAHVLMSEPIPFRHKDNPNNGGNIDYNMVAPLAEDGSNFPCKGYHTDFDTPAGAPTATYAAGQKYSVKLHGEAEISTHNGGSCQLSLSFDKGATWEVIKSFIGNCPANPNDTLDFEMPADIKTGKAIFSWTWFNNTGNREMYQNCAAVEITGGSGKSRRASRPAMFRANTNNGCSTEPGKDVQFPDPGAVVENRQSRGSGSAPPVGGDACGAAGPVGPAPAGPAPQVSAAVEDAQVESPAPEVTAAPTLGAPKGKKCKRWTKKAAK